MSKKDEAATPDGTTAEDPLDNPTKGERPSGKNKSVAEAGIGNSNQIPTNTPRIPNKGTKKLEVFEGLKTLVPGKTEYHPARKWEMQVSWMSLLGDYNGIQTYINDLYGGKGKWEERNKNPQDTKDEALWADPEGELRRDYEAIEKTIEDLNLNVSTATKERIKENLKQEKGKKIRMDDYFKDIDETLKALIEERRKKLAEIIAMMVEDLKKRLHFLKKQWTENPPRGYQGSREAWLEYCDDLLKALDAIDYDQLDDGNPLFPEGSKAYEATREWWNYVSVLEDAYLDFKNGSKEELSIEVLEKEANELKKVGTKAFSPHAVSEYNAHADGLIGDIDEVIALLEKQETKNEDEKKEKDSQIFLLKKNREKIKQKKNTHEEFKKILSDEDELCSFRRPGTKDISVPKGILNQIEFLKSAPIEQEERRGLMRGIQDSIRAVKSNVGGYSEEASVTFVQAREKLRLWKKGHDTGDNKESREIILVNPVEVLGHLWHSVQETVKGNAETESKRGAGYFQKQATEILAAIPNPTNNQIIKSLTELSPNGAQEAEHAEHGRVGDIEKGYDGFNTEHLLHVASESKDRWEFKACLKILAKRGRVDWYAPWLYERLNLWQKTIKIPTDKYWHMSNLTQSDDMLRQAFVYIYRDTEGYKELKNSNNGAYESKKSEFARGFGMLAAEPGGLKKEALKILNLYTEDHKKNVHFSKADPIKFEAIIDYAVDQGKMKGEERLFLFNKALAAGLLPFDRGAEMTKKNNTYPPFDIYDTSSRRGVRPTIADVQEWATYDDVAWDYYMHSEILQKPAVNQRIEKTISQGNNRVDHDDTPMLSGYVSAEVMERVLSTNGSGGFGLPVTGLGSLVVGDEVWLDMYAFDYNKRTRERNDLELARFVNKFARYDGIVNRKMYASQSNYWRLEPGTSKRAPRAGGSYAQLFGRDGDASIDEIMSGVREHLFLLDFDTELPLLRNLLSGKLQTNDAAKSFAAKLDAKYEGKIFGGKPPETVDDLFKVGISSYMQYITSTPEGRERINAMRAALDKEHQSYEEAVEKKREAAKESGEPDWESIKTLKMRLKEAEKKKNEVREQADLRAQGKEDPHGHHGHDEHGHGGHGDDHNKHSNGKNGGHGDDGAGHNKEGKQEHGHHFQFSNPASVTYNTWAS